MIRHRGESAFQIKLLELWESHCQCGQLKVKLMEYNSHLPRFTPFWVITLFKWSNMWKAASRSRGFSIKTCADSTNRTKLSLSVTVRIRNVTISLQFSSCARTKLLMQPASLCFYFHRLNSIKYGVYWVFSPLKSAYEILGINESTILKFNYVLLFIHMNTHSELIYKYRLQWVCVQH